MEAKKKIMLGKPTKSRSANLWTPVCTLEPACRNDWIF